MKRILMPIAGTAILAFMSIAILGAVRSEVADAAMKGDKAAVRTLIQQKADVNAAQPDGATALHWPVYRGGKDLTDMRIAAGANAKAATLQGSTPLCLASIDAGGAIRATFIKVGVDHHEQFRNGRGRLMPPARGENGDALNRQSSNLRHADAKDSERDSSQLMWESGDERCLESHGR